MQEPQSISEIQAGQNTPNADFLSDSRIKSGELLDIWCISSTKPVNIVVLCNSH